MIATHEPAHNGPQAALSDATVVLLSPTGAPGARGGSDRPAPHRLA